MRPLTGAGEVGIDWEGRTFILRPSFYAMSELGSPADIVALFALMHTAPGTRAIRKQQFLMSLNVLYACAAEGDDISPIVGWITERNTYRPGAADPPTMLILARALMMHGVQGDAEPAKGRPPSDEEYTATFDAKDYVALAVAHLGATERDAWAMTMTGFVAAMRAKFPSAEKAGDKAPTVQEHDETMAWLKKVNEARGAKHV